MNTEIIHIDLKPLFCNHVSEDVVHKCLKCWWGIAETKEHDSGFKETKGSDKCGFPLILFVNANVVVSPSHIKLGEQSGILHVID